MPPAETTAPQETLAPSGTPDLPESPVETAESESPGDPSEGAETPLAEPEDVPVEVPGTAETSEEGPSGDVDRTWPEETAPAGGMEQYGPGGAPAKPDTGAVAGPGL